MILSMRRKAHILVVDDHALVRKGVVNLLKKGNWIVCGEAENGRQALEKVPVLKPDLVLMDLTMPVMDGIEATKEIRRLFPSTRVVVLSMHDSREVEAQAATAGADAYVSKSMQFEDLSRIVRQVLARNRQRSPTRI